MQLTAERLAGERGGEPVFSELSFALSTGEAMVVTGPNGSGKSTLLRILAGLLPAAGGQVIWSGSAGADPDERREACHYLGHRNAMKRELSVAENLAFWQRLFGQPHLSPQEAADAVGLGAVLHLPFGYLSAGQQRRIAIARLLVSHRPVWLLDEPTAALDTASERKVTELAEAHRASGGIVIAATHQPLGLAGAKELRMADFHPAWVEAAV